MKPDPDQLPVILLTETSAPIPALIAARGPHAGRRFVEFFTANIRNPNTRRAYYRAVSSRAASLAVKYGPIGHLQLS